MSIYLLDYGAGNVRSLVNAVKHLGYDMQTIETAADFDKAEKIIFPGVGAFATAMHALEQKGFIAPLQRYLAADRPFLGICVGMQCLFEGSDESPSTAGIGVLSGRVRRFSNTTKTVPHMGWNGVRAPTASLAWTGINEEHRYYFVHSYAVPYAEAAAASVLTVTDYADETFVSAVKRGRLVATQFHPEKSGYAGLRLLRAFLAGDAGDAAAAAAAAHGTTRTQLTRRVVACLDVRANDAGDLVVTKGDQYDVREAAANGGHVRNLGKPVDLTHRYFAEGADEICLLNITSFRNSPLADQPMLEVLRQASQRVFVPLTIGGGIRDLTEPDGTTRSALEVAGAYFRSGADKVSIGGDAVFAAEAYWASGGQRGTGTSSIEQIARHYGAQAVVVSVDPRRVYVDSPDAAGPAHRANVVPAHPPGPNGEAWCWYQCTVRGGRETRDIDARQLAIASEALGAGELLVNCVDQDGTGLGFDHALLRNLREAVRIPIVASSGAGCPVHFADVFNECHVEAALAAGIFHRREVAIEEVKAHLREKHIAVRNIEASI
ncbi:imidazole glycerol phosphate synthase [Syncephalis pseudoplumigaleata]|uniref:Imidazole glycerol phosphate synthase hisHF n=1 Tax=Syncephalis pseudoplumigaleata TaxID=1712513 RepID=A0A4P9YYA3_9FUNG|nr:imidazole glycerol phosphate synthase [Syncephalis pseudoplumigaleata]|eukprot:RKP24321.1 imidazole glycerol phosphate synthase [Syncephalis pseudoplumigaleata]